MRSIYNGTVLTVDLAEGKAKASKLDEGLVREWGGGLGVALALWKAEGMGKAFVLGTGPLTASLAPAGCAGVALGASPATGKPAAAPLTWLAAAELKSAGFDFVVIRGEAGSPVRLWIHDEICNVLDAGGLWAKDVWKTVDAERADHGDDAVEVLAVGPAGEAGEPGARLSESYWGSKDRAGLGAALGALKVKAIAIRGMGSFEMSEEAFGAAVQTIGRLRGSAMGLGEILERTGIGEGARRAMETRLHRLVACHGCPIPCNAFLVLEGDPAERTEPKAAEPGILLTNIMDAKVLEAGGTLDGLRKAMKEGRDPNGGSVGLPFDEEAEALGMTTGVCPLFLHLAKGKPMQQEIAGILARTTFFAGIEADELGALARKGAQALREARR